MRKHPTAAVQMPLFAEPAPQGWAFALIRKPDAWLVRFRNGATGYGHSWRCDPATPREVLAARAQAACDHYNAARGEAA
jgi:hypothetical protein